MRYVQMVAVASSVSLGVALLGGCGLGDPASCIDGVEFENRLYSDYESNGDAPTGAEIGDGVATTCGDRESDRLSEDPVKILEIQGVNTDIAIVVVGQEETLWVNSKFPREEVPTEVASYIR